MKTKPTLQFDKDSVRDSEKWVITTAITVHEKEHNCLLCECSDQICIALTALAVEIEIRNEQKGGIGGIK